MCLAGVSSCLAYDTDPNAVSEAGKNAGLNALSHRISVLDQPLPADGPMLGIITANLRAPTLETLAPVFRDRLAPEGFLVLSGIRSWETLDLKDSFSRYGMQPVWEKTDKDWTGLILAAH